MHWFAGSQPWLRELRLPACGLPAGAGTRHIRQFAKFLFSNSAQATTTQKDYYDYDDDDCYCYFLRVVSAYCKPLFPGKSRVFSQMSQLLLPCSLGDLPRLTW